MALCILNIAVLQINEELNTLKSQNSKLIKDLEQINFKVCMFVRLVTTYNH